MPARSGALLAICTGTICASLACAGLAALAMAPARAAGPGGGSPFWTEPLSRATKQLLTWRERGREQDAEAIRRIADQPTAVWLTGDDPFEQAEEVTRAAARSGRIPLLVAYNIPHRDCGQYSSGGAPDATAYRTWVARAAQGIGDRRAWVVLEPDAVAQWVSGCVPAPAAEDRLDLLAEAVRSLRAHPGVSVYLDAGNAGWIADQAALASALRRAGVAQANGFALNVANFHTTEVTRAYGDALSQRLGGAHYIIDTSRNGNGPLPQQPGAGGSDEAWCNPPGRALGAAPTTVTGDPRVDALVWVKRPGESDGSCRGAPPAGEWWPEYALGLATTPPTQPPEIPPFPAPPPAPPTRASQANPAAPAPAPPAPAAPAPAPAH
ncbi:glycoside hydrolase family 6 protein [Streptomyces orinoci]|uniref:Glucanase n=1 Tax=Streptomyces orinoci TaxID=67339 RepID=A0ABV3JV23_STRON|nr:glycoside hydrolase family 6 protein [Streptomyces orinoci]